MTAESLSRLGAASMLVLVAGYAGAQTPPRIDPAAIEQAIAADADYDVASLWRTLQIPASLDTVAAHLGAVALDAAPATFDRCERSCRAELTRANLDDDPFQELVLAIYRPSGPCRFLIFKSEQPATGDERWRFVGHADHDVLGQYDPEYRAGVSGTRRFFVMSAPGAAADGVQLHYDRWFEVSDAVREVLTLPADGLDCRDARSLCRAFSAVVVPGRADQFTVSFTVRYWGGGMLLDNAGGPEDIPLFTRSQRGVYDGRGGSYELNGVSSDLSPFEARTVFTPGALTCQDFLVFNADSLAQVASGPDAAARAWLTKYIDACEASPERTQLLEQLRR